MENEEQNDFRLEGTGFAYTLSLINGKYKMPILYCFPNAKSSDITK